MFFIVSYKKNIPYGDVLYSCLYYKYHPPEGGMVFVVKQVGGVSYNWVFQKYSKLGGNELNGVS